MKEKQKTCITIAKSAIANPATFTEYINIPHNVDIIVCKGMGFTILSGVPAIIDDAYYITSNLISNTHDAILGYGPNINYDFPVSEKQFKNTMNVINGTYTFNIYSVSSGNANNAAGNTSVIFSLEFIELEK